MTILIANIGTSDLAIKVDEIYLPIEFTADTNLDKSGVSLEWLEKWNKRREIVTQAVASQNFRGITEAISDDYDRWVKCLSPVRLGDIVATAIESFEVNTIYFFLTDQNPPHEKDTVYLFNILQRWFQEKYPGLHVDGINVAEKVDVRREDQLSDFYYAFFQEHLQSDQTLLVSDKGGTPQMGTALRMQAIASGIQRVLFVTPELNLGNILQGKPSSCQYASHWRYLKLQKYQTIQQLLSRWDFEGGHKLLEDWQETLEFLGKYPIADLSQAQASKQNIETALIGLKIALATWNLDLKGAQNLSNSTLNDEWIQSATNPKDYDSPLNLYTKCCLYWQLGQAANLLFYLGVFYEETLHKIFIALGDNDLFIDEHKPKWHLRVENLRQQSQLWDEFARRESRITKFKQEYYRFDGRFTKRNFAEALFTCKAPEKESNWTAILSALKKLDYWFDKRNEVTHGGQGLSIDRLEEILKEDRQKNEPLAGGACKGEDILLTIANIYRNLEQIVGTSRTSTYVQTQRYYIYSDAVDWVNKILNRDIISGNSIGRVSASGHD